MGLLEESLVEISTPKAVSKEQAEIEFINPMLAQHKKNFEDLMQQITHMTNNPIIFLTISHDSAYVFSITKNSNSLYVFRIFDAKNDYKELEYYKQEFGQKDDPNSFIKAQEILRFRNKCAVPYLNNGEFILRILDIDKKFNTKQDVDQHKKNISLNKLIGIDKDTYPNQEYAHPFISACFKSDDHIFCNVFHNATLMHYHFILDTKNNTIL
jgi:hypothetical protein